MKLLFVGVLLCTTSVVSAQVCNPNVLRIVPDSRYELVQGTGGSEILDKHAGLIWQRCSVGQTWSGSTCTGTSRSLGWDEALKQAKNYGAEWRLPNIKELESLLEDACHSASINDTFFPMTPNSTFWSSSPDRSSTLIWVVSFQDGISAYDGIGNFHTARAVRTAP